MRVVRYTPSLARDWDVFLQSSKNGIFLFRRGYMDYHQDRFEDNSLVFLDEKDEYVAILPASKQGTNLISHGGLTFGGMVTTRRMTVSLMLAAFDAMLCYLTIECFSSLRYKALPHMYHQVPSEEDLYALFRAGARLGKREVTTVIDMRCRLPVSKGRRSGVSKAKRLGVSVRETNEFHAFMAIEAEVLQTRHNAKPVHTAQEIELLATRFPKNIRLFGAYRDQQMCAGAVVYVHDRVAHMQYMAANEIGRECGALDLLICSLLEDAFKEMCYFDFGISTECEGAFLNTGLIAQKEMFGGRAMVHETYDLAII